MQMWSSISRDGIQGVQPSWMHLEGHVFFFFCMFAYLSKSLVTSVQHWKMGQPVSRSQYEATNALCAARKGTKNIGSVCSMTSIFAAIVLFHR